jgi:hypothetical protein
MTKPILVKIFDPLGQFKQGISLGPPRDGIVTQERKRIRLRAATSSPRRTPPTPPRRSLTDPPRCTET